MTSLSHRTNFQTPEKLTSHDLLSPVSVSSIPSPSPSKSNLQVDEENVTTIGDSLFKEHLHRHNHTEILNSYNDILLREQRPTLGSRTALRRILHLTSQFQKGVQNNRSYLELLIEKRFSDEKELKSLKEYILTLENQLDEIKLNKIEFHEPNIIDNTIKSEIKSNDTINELILDSNNKEIQNLKQIEYQNNEIIKLKERIRDLELKLEEQLLANNKQIQEFDNLNLKFENSILEIEHLNNNIHQLKEELSVQKENSQNEQKLETEKDLINEQLNMQKDKILILSNNLQQKDSEILNLKKISNEFIVQIEQLKLQLEAQSVLLSVQTQEAEINSITPSDDHIVSNEAETALANTLLHTSSDVQVYDILEDDSDIRIENSQPNVEPQVIARIEEKQIEITQNDTPNDSLLDVKYTKIEFNNENNQKSNEKTENINHSRTLSEDYDSLRERYSDLESQLDEVEDELHQLKEDNYILEDKVKQLKDRNLELEKINQELVEKINFLEKIKDSELSLDNSQSIQNNLLQPSYLSKDQSESIEVNKQIDSSEQINLVEKTETNLIETEIPILSNNELNDDTSIVNQLKVDFLAQQKTISTLREEIDKYKSEYQNVVSQNQYEELSKKHNELQEELNNLKEKNKDLKQDLLKKEKSLEEINYLKESLEMWKSKYESLNASSLRATEIYENRIGSLEAKLRDNITSEI